MLSAVLKYSIGSSPRVWGQDTLLTRVGNIGGIIPTRVGTSCKTKKLTGDLEDHPHACGDKNVYIAIVDTFSGSSPRVWGQGSLLD